MGALISTLNMHSEKKVRADQDTLWIEKFRNQWIIDEDTPHPGENAHSKQDGEPLVKRKYLRTKRTELLKLLKKISQFTLYFSFFFFLFFFFLSSFLFSFFPLSHIFSFRIPFWNLSV